MIKDEPKQPVFVFNEQAVADKFAKLQSSIQENAGKKGHNPFLWWKRNAQDLYSRFNKAERTKELQDAVLALPDSIQPVTVVQEEQKIITNVTPMGIKLPSPRV